MSRAVCVWLFAMRIVVSTEANAQVDPIVSALNHCDDTTRSADQRIKSCRLVIEASGITSDEVAFAWLDLGNVYDMQHDDPDELDAYNKSIALEPRLWLTRLNRAVLYLRHNEIDPAYADFQAARAAPPGTVELEHFDMGVGYRTVPVDPTSFHPPNTDSPERDQAQFAQTLGTIGRALQTGFTRRCRSGAIADVRLDAALADCNTALKLDPKNAIALDSRGFVEFRQQDWADALADYQAALLIDAKSSSSLYMKGLVELHLGNAAAGNADIAAAKAAWPDIANDYARGGIGPQ